VKRLAVALVAALVVALVPTLASATQAASSTPSCTRLVVGTTTVEGADGAGYLTILFANAGVTCELSGYPSVQLFVPHATRLRGHDVHRSSMVFVELAPRRVILEHGQVASVGVTWSDDPKSHQTCSTTQWANVVLPGPTRQNCQPSANATPCGTTVWVTPFEDGAEPDFTWNAPPS